MNSRKIIAVFDDEGAARAAAESLREMGIDRERISIAGRDSDKRMETEHARGGFWAHVREMFMPDEDRTTLQEHITRGGYVLSASVADDQVDGAIERLERSGAIDLSAREAEWRATGWDGAATSERPADADLRANGEATAASREARTGDTARASRAASTSEAARDSRRASTDDTAKSPRAATAADEDTIPVVEERLRIGKREVNRGGVRVRSYIVEEPVHEEVKLRQERVEVDRRPVNQPTRPVASGSPQDLMKEQTLEISETTEQAVVAKEAVITEEVNVRKVAEERTEQIDDTIRRTEVEVEPLNPPGGSAPRRPPDTRPAPRGRH